MENSFSAEKWIIARENRIKINHSEYYSINDIYSNIKTYTRVQIRNLILTIITFNRKQNTVIVIDNFSIYINMREILIRFVFSFFIDCNRLKNSSKQNNFSSISWSQNWSKSINIILIPYYLVEAGGWISVLITNQIKSKIKSSICSLEVIGISGANVTWCEANVNKNIERKWLNLKLKFTSQYHHHYIVI